MRSLPPVAVDQVGVMGISWGRVITSTVIGLDARFAFAIPTYGCGDLATAENQYGRALGDNPVYREFWNPLLRLAAATMPVLVVSLVSQETGATVAVAAVAVEAKAPLLFPRTASTVVPNTAQVSR